MIETLLELEWELIVLQTTCELISKDDKKMNFFSSGKVYALILIFDFCFERRRGRATDHCLLKKTSRGIIIINILTWEKFCFLLQNVVEFFVWKIASSSCE